MKRIAVFPGSFDPVTKGHEDIINRASGLFDEIVVAIGINTTKKYMFSLEQRLAWLEKTFEKATDIKVVSYSGLTVDFCDQIGAQFMLRGLRSSIDFEYERSIAQMSKELNSGIETVLFYTSPELSAINSSIVREILKNNGDVSTFIPKNISIEK